MSKMFFEGKDFNYYCMEQVDECLQLDFDISHEVVLDDPKVQTFYNQLLFYDLMEFYPDFERELLFGCIDGYLKDDCRNYLYGFLDGLHYSDRMLAVLCPYYNKDKRNKARLQRGFGAFADNFHFFFHVHTT